MHKNWKKFTGRIESKLALGLVREESKVVQILNYDMKEKLRKQSYREKLSRKDPTEFSDSVV